MSTRPSLKIENNAHVYEVIYDAQKKEITITATNADFRVWSAVINEETLKIACNTSIAPNKMNITLDALEYYNLIREALFDKVPVAKCGVSFDFAYPDDIFGEITITAYIKSALTRIGPQLVSLVLPYVEKGHIYRLNMMIFVLKKRVSMLEQSLPKLLAPIGDVNTNADIQ
jgi:hypothetical protein